ncbi:MAG TPA: ABC transporter permease [Polyangia bacterium]|nr:ABC transporter permease [Polyangia bacterium]
MTAGSGNRRRGVLVRMLASYVRRPSNIVALAFLALTGIVALAADLLAAEKPLACNLDGKIYVLPVYTMPLALADHDNHSLAELVRERGGWTIAPPIPFGPNQTKRGGRVDWLRAPGRVHLLGTDDAGRDVLARIVHGTRVAWVVGLGSMLVSTVLGVFLGALAAYFGGRLDRVVLTLVETLSAFPALFFLLALQGLLGTGSLWRLIAFIGLLRWTDVARVTRAEVLRVVNEEYVDAARALGLGHLRVLRRHVLPGAIGPVLVSSTFGVAGAVLIESTLSFLGFGVPPLTASWGQLLTDAFFTDGCWWLVLFPGLMLAATVLAINMVGGGLREAAEEA